MLTKILVGFIAAFIGLFTACGIALLQGGIATVYVQNEDFRFYIPIPVTAVELALSFVPAEELKDARHELKQVKDIIPAVIDALAECPDTILVEVESGSDKVLVEKIGNTLVVKVNSSDNTKVRVKIPLRGAKRVFKKVTEI